MLSLYYFFALITNFSFIFDFKENFTSTLLDVSFFEKLWNFIILFIQETPPYLFVD